MDVRREASVKYTVTLSDIEATKLQVALGHELSEMDVEKSPDLANNGTVDRLLGLRHALLNTIR
jgi:hypothetical protein